jgi:predicted GNAT family acetyltransferase
VFSFCFAATTAYRRTLFSVCLSTTDVTQALLPFVPNNQYLIWKVISEAVTQEIKQQFMLSRERAFISFSDVTLYAPDSSVHISTSPSLAALGAYAELGHEASWLQALLETQQAFCCELKGCVCFAFANHQSIWEVGGVFTPPESRGRGLAARVVRACIAELQRRGLRTRYQVHEDNLASIALAKHLLLEQVCVMTHWQNLV